MVYHKKKEAEKIYRFFPRPCHPKLNYENYLGSKILKGIIHSSKEIPPCW